ncbi:Hypothetical protein FKW44_019763 [Caligus rogercresseyi]|uniref:Uncharacterized protein n=1 Tax=Caligus rogercresseyi TaxID=217165 RepID=A0A7T8JXL9_CALRO|nr:Hypothetical protein FKW44_019763 [Caligus rogercresseyi]
MLLGLHSSSSLSPLEILGVAISGYNGFEVHHARVAADLRRKVQEPSAGWESQCPGDLSCITSPKPCYLPGPDLCLGYSTCAVPDRVRTDLTTPSLLRQSTSRF